jgi:outer membrane protein
LCWSIAVIILVVLSFSCPGFTREMSLADCVAAALELNADVRVAKESAAQARSGISEARSGFLPYLSLGGSYNFAEKTQEVSFPDPVTGQMQSFQLDFTRDYFFDLSLQQPVYSGGRLTSSYRMAKHSHEIALADLDRRQTDVALQVFEAFYLLLLAREQAKLAEEALENAQEFLRVARARYETGEASSFEVMRAEVEVSNLMPRLIEAENAMGIDPGADIDFVGSFGEHEGPEIELEDAIHSAFENRPEMRIASMQERLAGEAIRLAKAGKLPSVSLSASYDFRSDELSLDGDEWERTYAGYLVLSFPLFDGLRTKSQVRQSISQLRQAEIAVASLKDVIELQIRTSLLDIEASLETLNSQEKNVDMAEEGLDIANERYAQGFATNLEVMDAQLALSVARNNRILALHDLSVAVARLKQAMGTLLKDYNVGARP